MGEVDGDRIAVDGVLLLLLSGQLLLFRLGLRLRAVGGLLRCVWTVSIDRSCWCCRSSASRRAWICCWLSKFDTCCGLAVAGRIGRALAGADFLLPRTRLETLAIPMRATIATKAITTGILFRRGGLASICSGTVAGGF
jgi:hypothetical protein